MGVGRVPMKDCLVKGMQSGFQSYIFLENENPFKIHYFYKLYFIKFNALRRTRY